MAFELFQIPESVEYLLYPEYWDYPHIRVTILADSENPMGKGSRLTTFKLEYPRYIHAEVMTYRMFSRNAQSSRAMPTAKLLDKIRNNPVVPLVWTSNKKGMQGGVPLYGFNLGLAKNEWLKAAEDAVLCCEQLHEEKLHKQYANRLIEPFSTITVICSATDWANFFHQRISPLAMPEITLLAIKMLRAIQESTPRIVGVTGSTTPPQEWHLPFIKDQDQVECSDNPDHLLKVSAARCARVSYLNHDGTREIQKDLKLYDHLVTNGHWTPLEHVACPESKHVKGELSYYANYRGFRSLRFGMHNENIKG